jgi:serine/threonine protein kinase
VQGGDFFTLMRKFKRIPEDWVRLYVIEVAMALQHLHDMDVVYRDLKPENILLCGDGHLKLTDFGLSRFFETRPPAPEDMLADDNIVTRSFCGTEQYMSPEMLLQQGHNFRMDWWCLGLLMHEMISARHPFNGPSHYDTLRNMVTKPPTMDPRLSPGAAAVVKHFLIKNPRTRLCCKDGTAEMKALPYFGIIDWDALYHRRIEMPYKPKLVGDTDVSSFENTFTRERPIDSNPDPEGADAGKKKAGKGGLLGLFGYGKDAQAANAKTEAQADNDAFKGFSFAKDESAAAAVGGGAEAGGLPVPPAARTK